jgi:polar amino acid transport system substrate-binding protein
MLKCNVINKKIFTLIRKLNCFWNYQESQYVVVTRARKEISMKIRGIAIFLIFILTVFTGCAHRTGNVARTSGAPVLDHILKKGEIIVGTAGSMPPLNMTTREGDVIGLEIDIARAMASAMGVKLRLETMPFAELLPSLEEGRIDMIISGMTMTSKRNLNVAFVGPYMISGKSLLTKAKTMASVDDTTEINSPGTKLAALKGSTSELFVQTVLFNTTLVTVKDYDEGVDMVIRDEVHAFIADYPICAVSVIRYPDEGLMSVSAPFTYEPLGIAIPTNDPHLVNWTENFLKYVEGSGALEMLKKRWFEDSSWLSRLP